MHSLVTIQSFLLHSNVVHTNRKTNLSTFLLTKNSSLDIIIHIIYICKGGYDMKISVGRRDGLANRLFPAEKRGFVNAAKGAQSDYRLLRMPQQSGIEMKWKDNA